ncbi:MAG: hypothetical protein HYZ92_02060 [Candidatus Omnitrophica bacterium]|nr:hypothetical protein [Candidatus Omnitrophota bacterium]
MRTTPNSSGIQRVVGIARLRNPMARVRAWPVAVVVAGGCLAGCQQKPSRPLHVAGPAAPTASGAAARSPASAPEPATTQANDADRPAGPPLAIPLAFSSAPTSPYTVSSGIPFPRGAATSLKQLWLEDAPGHSIPAQFAALARWPDQSYKAALVTVNTLPAAPLPSYTLRSGPGRPPTAQATPLAWDETPQAITVTTGPIRFQVSKRRFGLFEQIWVDANQDHAFDDSERLLREPGEIFLIDAADGREYRASRDPKPRVAIEEAGPIRLVVLARGSLQADSGERLTDFIVRLSAAAGMDTVRVDYTLVDPRQERDVDAKRNGPALNVKGYGIRLPLRLGRPAQGLFGGDDSRGMAAFSGPLLDSQFLHQGGRFNYVDGALQPFSFFYDGVAQGERADGWVDAGDAHAGLCAMVRRFWQQFPKELAIDHDTMTIYLHPPRASEEPPEPNNPKRYTRPRTFYFSREGGAKTYQLLFQAHRGQGDPRALKRLYQTFEVSPRLVPQPAWLCKSGAFGNLLEAGPWSRGYDAYLIDGIYLPSVERKRLSGGLAVLYGWRDYGDRLRPGWADVWEGRRIPAFYNDTHVGARNFLAQYARTGDERWFDLGEEASRHWMDIDVSHADRLGHWRHGYGPGEGHLIKHDLIDHTSRNLHAGHAHISGLPDYYLLTGDARTLEVIREVGNWWANAVPDVFPLPVPQPHYAEAERDYAWPLFVLNEAYRVTGELRYLKAASQIVKHLIGWWQQPSEHWANGKLIGRNQWRSGTGWWAMYPRQDNSPEPPKGKILYNGTNPWMAGALLGAVIQFRELDRDHGLADDELIEEMVLQTMNYVVKYGWNEEGRYFMYAESSPQTNGGMNHLVYPLAYCWRLYAKGGRPHPEWYDTAPKWIEIARRAYGDWQDVHHRGTTDQGFYGYEMIQPPDFFTLMRELEEAKPAPPSPPPSTP